MKVQMKINVEVLNGGAATKINTEEMNGDVFSFRKEDVIKLAELAVLKVNTVCYVLYSDFYDRNINNNEIYIGQTNSFKERMKQHFSSDLNWNKGIVIAFNTESHDVIFRLESDLIKLAKKSLKYNVVNVRGEDRGYICQCQKENYNDFLKLLKKTLSAINIDVFDRNIDGAFSFRDQPDLKAEIVDPNWPCSIRILSGSKAVKGRVGYLEDFFAQHEIKTEKREERVYSKRKGGYFYISTIEEYVFFDDVIITFQESERNYLYPFKSVNRESIVYFLADVSG